MSYQSVNPSDGKSFAEYPQRSASALDSAIDVAATCFETWKRKTFSERASVLTKVAALMRSHLDELARPITLEMGKLFAQAQGEVTLSADIVEYYAQNGERFLAPRR